MEEKEKDTKNAEKAIADEAETKKGKGDDCADIKERFLRLAANNLFEYLRLHLPPFS